MSDHFGAWPGGPDFDGDGFDGPDDGGSVGFDGPPEHGDYPAGGFGPDLVDGGFDDPGQGGDGPHGAAGFDDPTGGGFGYGADSPDVGPPDGGGFDGDGFDDPGQRDSPGWYGFGAVEVPVGADPDVGPHAEAWPEPQFPEPVELTDPPEPVDGYPWADPATLGGAGAALPQPVGVPEPVELAGYAGEPVPDGPDGWRTLAASDDPATSTLARFWGPGSG